MPSVIVHSYFIKDVYDKLPLDRKVFLKNETKKFDFFSHSIEPLKYYYSINNKKNKKIRSFYNFFHNNKINDFLITMINYIKYNYYKDDPEIMAMLYSLVSHYVIDSKINPYIFYKSGIFNKQDPNTYKYNSKIFEIENAIDKYLIKVKEKTLPYKYKHYKEIFTKPHLTKNTIEVIDFSFKETFSINKFSKTWISSSKKIKKFYKIFRYDPMGIKCLIYKIFDKISSKKTLKISYFSYKTKNKNSDYLNKNNTKWNYPTSKRKKSKKSFIELYTESISDTIKIIEEIDQYIYQNKKINLKKLLKNISYTTGIEINKPQEMKYFEF